MEPLIVRPLWGLGDTIYQRAFIREVDRLIYLETPFPELFEGFGHVRFIQGNRGLRTQEKNIRRTDQSVWVDPPRSRTEEWKISYGSADFKRGSLIDALYRAFKMPRTTLVRFDLPEFRPPRMEIDKPIALVRPVTVRKEWRNESRNPLPEYVSEISKKLMASHHVVCIADLAEGEEWLVGHLPPHHQAFLSGQFQTRQLLGLVQRADVLVGGVGWIVPAAIAARKKAFIILGGNGEHNAPKKILDAPTMDLSNVGFATPQRYCLCDDMRHECNKTIRDLDQQFDAWATKVSLSTTCSTTA